MAAAAAAWGIAATKASKLRGAARVTQAVFPTFASETGLGEFLSKKIESLYEISTLDVRYWPALAEHVRRGLTREKLRERIHQILYPTTPVNHGEQGDGHVTPGDDPQIGARVAREWRYPGPAPDGFRWIEARGRVVGIEMLEAQPPTAIDEAAEPDEVTDTSTPEAVVSTPTVTRFDLLGRDDFDDGVGDEKAADADVHVTVADMEAVVRSLKRVEPTTRLLARLREVAPGASITEAWDTGALDAYQLVFGAEHATEVRTITGKSFGKAKEEFRRYKIAMTDKVRTSQPRTENQGKPVVFLLGDDVIGVGRYDDLGRAPAGHVFLAGDGHVVLVDVRHLDCDRALIFRADELNAPTSQAEAAAAE